MSFTFRRRIKIAPGTTVNLGKRGMSLSVGAGGARATLRASGDSERGDDVPPFPWVRVLSGVYLVVFVFAIVGMFVWRNSGGLMVSFCAVISAPGMVVFVVLGYIKAWQLITKARPIAAELQRKEERETSDNL